MLEVDEFMLYMACECSIGLKVREQNLSFFVTNILFIIHQ